ncbi:dNTP triphosphohydrolase [Providencia rettgeri]|nr:dNTP triphosphohydrolase [Providencia rettgeri]
MLNQQVKDFAIEKEKMLSEALSSKREHNSNDSNIRSRDDFQRDYARILYSSSFRRLQGKMQLFEVNAEKFNRNRLTHSLEVAQIARNIACDLGMKTTVVAELAALAHDIGNPPFGHSGERQLSKLTENIGGYEGNAQALRILRKLERKQAQYEGLNLTYRSLFSVIKYPNRRDDNKKFLYDEDYNFYQKVIVDNHLNLSSNEQTIDCQIMDLADEIAYAAHDLEDALSHNMVNIEDIEYEFMISEEYSMALTSFQDIINKSKDAAIQAEKLKSSEEFSIIYRKELTSNIVNTLCRDITVVSDDAGVEKLGFGKHKFLSMGLKKLLFKVIMRKRNILAYESRGNKIITELYEFYNHGNNIQFLSPELKSSISEDDTLDHVSFETKKNRAVRDYIAGMMDTFAIKEWETHCK